MYKDGWQGQAWKVNLFSRSLYLCEFAEHVTNSLASREGGADLKRVGFYRGSGLLYDLT